MNTTNIRRIADRVMRHPMMRDIPFETLVEYAVDFIQLLGVPALYDSKICKIKVSDWKGLLPPDLEQITQVRIWSNDPSRRGVFRASSNNFHLSQLDKEMDLTYKVQGSIIITSIKEADIEVAYKAFAVDEEGYPLLPDNASFLRGLENFIKLHWFTILFDLGKIPAAVMDNVQREYAWAVGDAQSEFARLTVDEAETLFNSFKSLLPRVNEHKRGFMNNGTKGI